MAIIYGGFDVEFPRMVKVRQRFRPDRIANVRQVILQELDCEEIRGRFRQGQRIAVAVGSRGIASIAEITKTVIDKLKELGTHPFIVPAMGSHGGANPDGQKEVLMSYGITEATMEAPIEASMEVIQLGTTASGTPVFFSKPAYEADGVVVVNRVKNHTNFRGPVESGLMKMLVIGLGKHKGATYVHKQGFERFAQLIPEVGRAIIERAPITCGLALVENGYHEQMLIRAVTPDKFEATDMELLDIAHAAMPRILFDAIDVLIVEKIGKNISGSGMDPNVTGRFSEPFMMALRPEPRVQKVVVLGLTEESHGNAIGLGSADVTTTSVIAQIDKEKTYANAITSTILRGGAIPMALDNDLQAIAVALKTCNRIEPSEAKVVRIRTTANLDEIEISESLLPEAEANDNIEISGQLRPMAFTDDGRLL